jgi:TonB family protein
VHALVPLQEGGPPRPTVFLSLTTREPADTVQPPLDRAARDVSVLSLPVFRDAVPFAPTPGIRGPRYPLGEKSHGIEGDVHVSFVIDERGAVVMPTVRLVRFSGEPFARAVYDALKEMRFTPATIGGCPVKQLVRTPFQFRMAR